jgi:hypothetical protein
MLEMPIACAAPSDPSQDAREAFACGVAHGRTEQRLAMLRELSEIGMRLARGVERQAETPETASGDLGLAFSRIARAVRQTLALEARLEGEREACVQEERAMRDQQLARAARSSVERRSKLVRRAVGQAIESDAEENDFEQLFDDLDERLGDREDDDDFLDRPVSELVARICKDLGVAVDWSLWEDEGWALAEAAARAKPPPGDASGADLTGDLTPAARPRAAGTPNWLSG